MTCYACFAKDVTIAELRQTVALLEERLIPLDQIKDFSDFMLDAYATLAKMRPEAPPVPIAGVNDFERRLFTYLRELAIWGKR